MDEQKGVQSGAGEEKTCHACGAVHTGHFCPVCGAKSKEEMTFCPVCGMDRKDDAAFCLNCGFSFTGQATGVAAVTPAPNAPKPVFIPRKVETQVTPTTQTTLTRRPAAASKTTGVKKKPLSNKTKILIGVAAAAVVALIALLIYFMTGSGAGSDKAPSTEGLVYLLNDDGVSYSVASSDSEMLTGEVRVPETIQGRPVTAIKEHGFANMQITSVVLPASVTTIENGAFYGCEQLTSITLTGVSVIGDNAFENCVNLTDVTLRNHMSSIGKSAFGNCKDLTSIVLPVNLYFELQEYAFSGCDSLVNVGMGGLREIPTGAFADCSSLSHVNWNTVKTIGEDAFAYCTGLASVSLPDSVKTVKDQAFFGCSSLTSFTLGRGVTSFGVRVLANCSALESLSVVGGNITYTAEGNALYDTRKDMLVMGLDGCVISADMNLKEIAPYAFAATPLTSIEIPDNIEIVGEGAFDGCKNLTSIAFGTGFRYLGKFAFRGCDVLEEIHLATYEWNFSEEENGTYNADDLIMGMEEPARAVEVMRNLNGFYFISSATGNDEEGTHTLTTYYITVTDDKGSPVSGVSVRLRNVKTGEYTEYVRTDVGGVATFTDIPLLTYDVQLVLPPMGYTHEDRYQLETGGYAVDGQVPEGTTQCSMTIFELKYELSLVG